MFSKNQNYVPTLAIRPNEMNGLERLPGITKDAMYPCVLLAPWMNSKSIENATKRFEKAFPNRPYFLDIDKSYRLRHDDDGEEKSTSNAQAEFQKLLDPTDSYKNWCDFALKSVNCSPCLQIHNQTEADIRKQISRFQSDERNYAARIVLNKLPENPDILRIVSSSLSAEGTDDFAIILEGEWTKDPLGLMAQFDYIINNVMQTIDARIPIIVSCTSFPKEFTDFDHGLSEMSFRNRELVDQIRRRSNRTSIIYGDWATTRPREYLSFGAKPIERVDYPTKNSWYIARNKTDEWDFKNSAKAIIQSQNWSGNLGIWGEELIFNTATHSSLGINTAQKNVAARVNIHLHRQAFYNIPDIAGINLDEDWPEGE